MLGPAADIGINAGGHQLGTQLGIARTDKLADEAVGWAADGDAPARCPVVVGELSPTDRAALDARAESMKANAPAPAGSAPKR